MKLKLSTILPVLALLVILIGIPIGLLTYQSQRTGMTWSQIIDRMTSRVGGGETGLAGVASSALPKGEKIAFLSPVPIGNKGEDPARITHLQAVDLDRDGLLDVVACDAQTHSVQWIRQVAPGEFSERLCADGLVAPSHVQAADFDGDGDLDLMVAVLGMLFPNNDRIGSVVILENTGGETFTKRTVADRIARVSDVRAADLDGDGDSDLAVAQFGYDDGETRWIENLGDWRFESHILQTLSGPINVDPTDMDGDGDLDLVVLVSQEWEEIYVFENDGQGNFQPQLIYGSANDDFGSSGIHVSDFDQDGDADVLYTNGDAFDYIPPRPRPWHGVQWLENKGNLEFVFHRIADFAGAYSARSVDLDKDGDLDLVAVSAFNRWERSEAQSLIWLENDGSMRFKRRDLASNPTHLLVVDSGDFDGDGWVDLVTGGMHVYPPFDRLGRITLWPNRWADLTGTDSAH